MVCNVSRYLVFTHVPKVPCFPSIVKIGCYTGTGVMQRVETGSVKKRLTVYCDYSNVVRVCSGCVLK